VSGGFGCGPQWPPSPRLKEPPNPGKMGVIWGVKPPQKSTGGPAKNTWNIGRNRLACDHGIGLETRRRVARKARSANLKELGSRRLAPERLAAQSTRKANAGKRALKASESWISKAASVGIRDREIQTSKVQTVNYQRVSADLGGGRAQDVNVATLPASRSRAGLLMRHGLLA
jgi:hypothetical protein